MISRTCRTLAVLVATVTFAPTAGARTVAEEILDLLKANGQITDEQYESLMVRAREEAEILARAGQTPPVSADKPSARVYWKNGLNFENPDGRAKIKIGGRIQNDWAIFAEDDSFSSKFGSADNGTEFRRARLYVSGTLEKRVVFKSQFDFADGDVDFNDVFIGLEGLPAEGTALVGHFKEPFSLDNMTSSKYVTFQERSIAHLFIPGRNTGFGLFHEFHDQRMTWAGGVFRVTDSSGDGTNGGGAWNLTSRVTGLPIWQDEGAKLLHLGLSVSHQFWNSKRLRYRSRPAAHMAPYMFDTRSGGVDFKARYAELVAAEAALVWGPFSLQGEYLNSVVTTNNSGTPWFWGAYGQVSLFLTGEHRAYNKAKGAFGRVSPIHDFNPDRGEWGAFELALRFDHIDLDHGNISGGTGNEVTAGLNWYLFPFLRWTGNYVWADRTDTGAIHGWQTRFQLEF